MRAHLTATAPYAPNLNAYEKFACCYDIFLSVSTYTFVSVRVSACCFY